MTRKPEDHLLPNRSKESFICTVSRGYTEACGAGIRCGSSTLGNSERLCSFMVQTSYCQCHDVCIIMHNMIIDEEGPRVGDWSDDEAGISADRATSPVNRGLPYGVNQKLREEENMRNQQAHHALMSNVVDVFARRLRWNCTSFNYFCCNFI